MVQKYQNEIAPIFYYGISTKTNEKDLKIPNLQPPDWKSPYWMTLYMGYFQVFWSNYEYFQIFCGISDILIVFNGTFYGILRGILKC